LSPRAIPCVFLRFVPDGSGWQFYHPTSRRVFPCQDATFDKLVPFYRLFPYPSAPLPPPPLFLAPGPPPVDPLPPQGPAPSGVSQVDPLPGPAPVQVAVAYGAARGAASGGAEPRGAESEGAGTGGAEPGGVETRGAELGGAESEGVEPGGVESEGTEFGGAETRGAASSEGSASTSPRLSPQHLREWFVRRTCLRSGAHGAGGIGATGARGSGAAGAGGTGVAAGAGVSGGTVTPGAGGARTRGTGVAGTGGVEGAGAGNHTDSGTPSTGGAGAGGAGVGGPGAGGTGVGGPCVAGAGAGLAGAVASGGTVRPQPYFVPLLLQVLGTPPSAALTPPLLCPPPDQSQPPLQLASPLPTPSPYTEQSGGLTKRQSSLREVPEPASDRARAASPTVSHLLATAVTDPPFESTTASDLIAELLEFAPACRLDYASALVAEFASASPPSVEGECALGTDVLKDRQEDFECLAAAVPRFASMLLAPEGDPDAPDIPTPRSYAEAITGPYSSQWQSAMDAKMASWNSTGTYVDEVPPPGANIVNGMWIFRVKWLPGSPPAFKARYVARGFSQRQGVDYFQTFSPTLKMTTLRGSLHEEIWLRRPPGFTESFPASTKWSLWRPVYGLRQALCEWHDTLRTTLATLGYAPATADPSLFLRTDTSLPPFYVLVYVDDLVFATADAEALTLVKSELQKRYTCTDLVELRSYLSLQITRDRARRTITLTHSHMVHHVLQRFGFQFSPPQPTPLSTSHSLLAPPSDESVEPSGPYPELVGCLMYLMTCTLLDLAYTLSLGGSRQAPKGSGDAVEKRSEPPPSKIEALDGSNYEEWSGRMRSAFKRYKLLKIAMGEEKMPGEGDARDRWIEKSAVLYDLILQSVNNDMFQHIKDLVELDDSGPKAWKLLRDVIQPNTLPMVIVLEKELAALSMKPGDGVKPVLDKIKDIYARMAAAGSEVSQMQQCTKIISVLDNSWDNLIPTLNVQQDKWTPEWLRQQILQEDFRRRHTGGGAANKTAEGYGAAGGSRGRGGGRGRGRGRGFGRGRGRGDYNEGHVSSGGRGSTRMEGACWYCKKAGHPWFKCFSRHEGWAPPGMKPPSGERARGDAVQGSGAQGDGAQGKADPGMFLMVEDVQGSGGDVGSVGKVVMHPLTHWVIDSGCTSHMTPRADLLDEVKPPRKIKFVVAASGDLLPVIGVGNAKVMGANGELVGLGNVLLVEGLSANLLSVRRLQKSKAEVTFGPTSCRAKLGKLLLWNLEEKSSCIKDLWQLPIIPWKGKPPATAKAAAAAKATAGGEEIAPTAGALDAVKKVQQPQQPYGELLAGVDATGAWAKASSGNGEADWETWHERLCHVNIPMLQKLVKDGCLKGLEVKGGATEIGSCPTCLETKFTKFPFSSSTGPAKAPLALVHMDVVGPTRALSLSGSRYFLTIVDDHTRAVWVYPLKTKGEVAAAVLKEWMPRAQRESGHKVKVIRTDNGGEFIGADFEKVLKRKGIQHQLTVPYNPQQNGVAERFNRTLQEGARTLLGRAGLPDPFWVTALRQVVVVKNQVLATVGDKQWVPYTKWYGSAPAVNMLRTYGCMVVFHVPKEKRGKQEASGRWVGSSADALATPVDLGQEVRARGMGLVLGGRGLVVLTGHADASWVDDSATQRSSQGYTFSLVSGSVSWRSTCLSSVLSSSCEAEIYDGAMAAQELRWLTYLLTDLGEQPRSPPVMYIDNKAMIALCQEH
ncbi:unnamed protein product, partial [Closterium sp. NIES-53]